jgi:hypothetical protein
MTVRWYNDILTSYTFSTNVITTLKFKLVCRFSERSVDCVEGQTFIILAYAAGMAVLRKELRWSRLLTKMVQLLLFAKFENLRPNVAVYDATLVYVLSDATDMNESNFTGGPFTQPLTPRKTTY